MSINMFDYRTLLSVLTYMKDPTTFILDMFFTKNTPVETTTIDIDIEREGDRMAAFCSSLVEGETVENLGYSTNTVTPGYTKEKILISPKDLMKRDAGNIIYAPGASAEQRLQEKVAKALKILLRRVIRREEWMAITALLNGSYTMTGKGLKTTVDFGMKASHKVTLAGNDLWTATTTSNPIDFMKHAIRDLIIEDSGLSGNHKVIMGTAAAESFLAHPAVQAALDKKNIFIGEIKPGSYKNGGYKIADWLDPNCEIWVYAGKYTDSSTGVRTNLLPSNMVLFGSADARCERHFAAIEDLDVGVTAAVPYFAKSWSEKDPSGQVIMMQSAPLPAPHQIDGFVTATVQAAE